MISETRAKLLGMLPDKLMIYLVNKTFDRYLKKYATIKCEGKENLTGIKRPVIFICNHLSNSDALIMHKVLQGEDVTYVAGIKLSQNKVTSVEMKVAKTIPIKPNSADKEAISKIIKTLKGGTNIFIFPEGTRSRNAKMLEAKKGIVLIARMAKVPVVPMCIFGSEKFLPINDEDMGKEEFHSADITVKIGKPMELPEKLENENKHEYEERASYYFMKNIADLLPEEYRGFYGEKHN